MLSETARELGDTEFPDNIIPRLRTSDETWKDSE